MKDIDQNMESARRQLTDLATISSQTDEMERKILRFGEQRLAIVTAELAQIDPASASGDESVGAKYTELVEERDVLHQVIARARSLIDQ